MDPQQRQEWEAGRIQAAEMDAWLESSEVQPRGPEAWIQKGFDWLLSVLDLENQIVMTEGVRFLDTFGDLLQGICGSLGIPINGVDPIWKTGSLTETWRSAWDPVVQGLPFPGMDQDFQYTRP